MSIIKIMQPTQEELLAAERTTYVCSVRQARIVLGPEVCASLDASIVCTGAHR